MDEDTSLALRMPDLVEIAIVAQGSTSVACLVVKGLVTPVPTCRLSDIGCLKDIASGDCLGAGVHRDYLVTSLLKSTAYAMTGTLRVLASLRSESDRRVA